MNTKIVTVAEMRRLEAAADAAGVSYAAMMERAGKAVAEAILARVTPSAATALLLIGPGNNGGDGLVAARHLAKAGAAIKIYALKPLDESDPKVAALREQSAFIVDAENDRQSRVLKHLLGSATAIVDSLFGTGARLPLPPEAAQILRHAAARVGEGQRPPLAPLVVAVDCPSGLNCDTGELDPATLRADLTVTFGAAKVGQYKFPAADFVNELIVAPIGWPDDLAGLSDIRLELAQADSIALPPRRRDAHKYAFGRVLVVAGSQNYTGAAYLTGAAACRSGAGLVTMAVPESIHPILASQLVEATWLPLSGERAADAVRHALQNANALIIGPGLGVEPATANFLRAVFTPAPPAQLRVLADADGLRLLAAMDGWPDLLPRPAVLTPHIGEMAALTGLSKQDIEGDRLATARRFAARWGHVVVLKGAFTVVAAPDGRTTLEPFANAALAKAGSGDVLSGLIGGLLAQGMAPYEAAVAGAFIHGRAAEIAARALGTPISLIARDLLAAVPQAFASLG
ncbi:MAG: NAD(P)H-hydrate dehydratase [Chloroflexi bacterium]|nr:NAD(P)H-hydrate dehydratase [Chloroflexota bacterium]